MNDHTSHTVTLIGGTGFMGRALAGRLARRGCRLRTLARRLVPDAALPAGTRQLTGPLDDASLVDRGMDGADAAIYLPGLVRGRTHAEFSAVHVDGARRCAEAAARAGTRRFLFVSALGARQDAPALADRTKAAGEAVVLRAHAGAVVIRPSLVLGAGDHVTRPMADLMRRTPVLPVIGARTRIQPVHVDDLAAAIEALVTARDLSDPIFEAAGARVCTMLELLERIRHAAHARCRLLPLPDRPALALATLAERLNDPLLVRDQVRLMATAKVASGTKPGLERLGIMPQSPLDTIEKFL
jgi:uncharacterized protein YbjT (DUF2867 family)